MKKLYKIFMLLLMPLGLFAHSLVLNLIDNEDGTISIVGGFSTGESAAGALVKIKEIATDKILFEKRLNKESEVTIKIPKVAYNVILDGGPSHKVIRTGIPPKEGFIESKKENTSTNIEKSKEVISDAIKYPLAFAYILFLATIIVTVVNTNRLIKKLN